MKPTLYPSFAEALVLHEKLIERFGGSPGILDKGLLQSALARPQSGYYSSLSLEAAALLQSLTQNHAFVDGNKRVAFALSAIFLRMNGFRLIVDPDNGEHFIIVEIIQNKVDLHTIATWLEKHMKEI